MPNIHLLFKVNVLFPFAIVLILFENSYNRSILLFKY